MTHIVLFNIVLALCCAYAFYGGGAPERLTAALLAAAAAATFALPFYPGKSYHSVEVAETVIDLAMLVGMVGIALRANRFWPLYISALHLITIAIHGVKAYEPDLVPWMYAAASGKIAYPMLIILALGVLRHRRRVSEVGTDPDWSPLR